VVLARNDDDDDVIISTSLITRLSEATILQLLPSQIKQLWNISSTHCKIIEK